MWGLDRHCGSAAALIKVILRHTGFRCTDEVVASMRYYEKTKTMTLRSRTQAEFALAYARHEEYDALFAMVMDMLLVNGRLEREQAMIRGGVFYRILLRWLGWWSTHLD